MTPELWHVIHDWRRDTLPVDISHVRVVEIGSRAAEGQEWLSVRALFAGAKYRGIDIQTGPDVDTIADMSDCQNWDLLNGADIVLCLETLEHVPAFWQILAGIKSRARAGMWVILSAPGIDFPEHRHPIDCYRFTQDGIRAALKAAGARPSFIHTVPDTLGYPCHVTGGQTQ